ncbi:MAG: TonB family protein [Ignavibacteriota bacterium]
MPENRQTTDSELLLQIVGYNSNAFEQIYNRYSATIYSLIKEIVTNPKQAEKILLNVFSVFLKRIDYYSTTSNNIFTWLTLLARNISIDTLKRMKFVEDIPIYSDEYEIEFILPNLSEQISLINLDERNQLSEKIKSYKSQLSEIQNLVLSLIYFEGLNEDEIAKRLSVPSATVRQKTLAIMETLHLKYTGQAEGSNGNKEILNLVKLESLGCLTTQERILFNQIRNNDPDFMWKEYGEYQNLTALLATVIPEAKPSHELNTELESLFTKILAGGDVDYPIVASEITMIEAAINPTPEPESEPIPEKIIIPGVKKEIEVIETIETKVEKDTGFHFKFRERDPKELSVLKNLEAVEAKPKSTPTHLPQPVVATIESDIKFKGFQKAPVRKPAAFVDAKVSSSEIKDVINAVIKEDNLVQNKVAPVEIEKPSLGIENDDPSIIIEELKPVKVKEDVVIKNRLIPNSSINLKEIFRKDENPLVSKVNNPVTAKLEKLVEEKPIVPVVGKPEIKIKTNEPPKEFRKSVFVDKNETIKPNNPVLTNINNGETLTKQSEVVKENPKPEPVVLKEEKVIGEKPAATVVDNKVSDPTRVKQPEPVTEKPEIKIKSIVPPREIKKTFTDAIKQELPNLQKPVVPIVEKTEIKIKTNEPVKEVLSVNTPSVKVEDVNQNKIAEPIAAVEEKVETNLKANVPITQREQTKTAAAKVEETFERIKPSVDRSNLKIRETVFVESIKKSTALKQEVIAPKNESKSEKVSIDNAGTLKESIDIDEILSKIEDEKTEPAVTNEAINYEKEIIKLRKKNRRNILVSAALITFLTLASVFVYINFKESPVKVIGSNTKSDQLNLAGQTNLVVNDDLKPTGETVNTVGTTETPTVTEKVVDKKVLVPPLPKMSTKEESTLFASNIAENLTVANDETPKQIAAAKTETIVPPKENKKVEEEPSFFQAVEEMPELIGGIKGLQKKIVYPEIAKRVGVEGKVIVQAIVDENGKVVSVSTIKGIGSGCDEVAMDAVRNSKFVPGKQRGKNVKVQVTIPIVFKK